MMDDPVFLLSHLRNSFITSDDTGMCEIILEGEESHEKAHTGLEKRPTTWPVKSVCLPRSTFLGLVVFVFATRNSWLAIITYYLYSYNL